MKTHEIPIPNPVTVLREESDQWAVLFNPDTSDAVGINPTGVDIWKAIDGTRDVDAICTQMTETHEDAPESAAEQVVAFIDRLEETGFVGLSQ